MTGAALVSPAFMAVPPKLPAPAMGSELLLYLERGLVVFAVLLLLLVFLYRSLVHGELPKAISGRGAEWSDLATETTTVTDSLQKQVNALRAELEGLKEEVRAGGRLRQ